MWARLRVFISSRFSRMMSVDFTSSPLMPMASALWSSAAWSISPMLTLMPRFTIS